MKHIKRITSKPAPAAQPGVATVITSLVAILTAVVTFLNSKESA